MVFDEGGDREGGRKCGSISVIRRKETSCSSWRNSLNFRVSPAPHARARLPARQDSAQELRAAASEPVGSKHPSRGQVHLRNSFLSPLPNESVANNQGEDTVVSYKNWPKNHDVEGRKCALYLKIRAGIFRLFELPVGYRQVRKTGNCLENRGIFWVFLASDLFWRHAEKF